MNRTFSVSQVICLILSLLTISGVANGAPFDLKICKWYIILDQNSILEVNEVRERFDRGEGRLWRPSSDSFGFSNSRLWISAKCDATKAAYNTLATIDYSFLDDVKIYEEGLLQPSWSLGDNVGVRKKFESYRLPLFPFDLTSPPVISIQTSGSLQAPISIWNPSKLNARRLTENILLGLYYGVFISLFLFNAILWLISRDRVFGFYAMFISLFALFQLGANGIFYIYDDFIFRW